ncbi:SDR family NAD(P)-dependent oxidoreductase [Lacisediminihabitans changchengi]|uniref:SDR family NAD(P)-dependent oxidoreductase n=1 Tax=Lacisediminihabitans changchengi TaxID=2787634 RepID=UPI003FD84532
MSKVWFVTGTSKGFGREFVVAALDRGDKVAATARNMSALDDLVEKYGDAVRPIQLDVTNREQAFGAVKTAHDTFGQIDIVVNNAGYGLFGTVEEITPEQLRDQLETNLFGVVNATQAVLPIMREQASGHTSSRCRQSAASRPSRTPVATMHPRGRSRVSPSRLPKRSLASASQSPPSSPVDSTPTGPRLSGEPRELPAQCTTELSQREECPASCSNIHGFGRYWRNCLDESSIPSRENLAA